jgi:type II secretory ATPase GspE/PulE/Tfp pilus assembly ATPase PilB-like protein
MAQRLVRRIHSKCSVERPVADEERKMMADG